MTMTPTELQLIGGGVILTAALGSYWYFKRRSAQAAANINRTDAHSDRFDEKAAFSEPPQRRAGDTRQQATDKAIVRDRRQGNPQRRDRKRVPPGVSGPREPLERFGAMPKMVSPVQSQANRLRDEQDEELARRRRQQDDDVNLLSTLAVIAATSDPVPASNNHHTGGFTGNGGSFGGAGASNSWGDSSSSNNSSGGGDSSGGDSGGGSSD